MTKPDEFVLVVIPSPVAQSSYLLSYLLFQTLRYKQYKIQYKTIFCTSIQTTCWRHAQGASLTDLAKAASFHFVPNLRVSLYPSFLNKIYMNLRILNFDDIQLHVYLASKSNVCNVVWKTCQASCQILGKYFSNTFRRLLLGDYHLCHISGIYEFLNNFNGFIRNFYI